MQTVEFNSDEYTLMGSLHLPGDKPAPFVIGCHGLMADRSSPKQLGLAHACCRQGIGYFRFDHRGCGDSQGEFDRVTSLEGRQLDLLNAIRLVRSLDACNDVIGLFGSSMGGTVCLSVYPAENITAMVIVAAPLHSLFPQAENHHLKGSFDISTELKQVKNIHIFHGEYDEVVPLTHARTLYELASQPKKLTLKSFDYI